MPTSRVLQWLQRLNPLGTYTDLLRDAAIYTAAGTLVRSVSIFIVPVLTRTLSIDAYGTVETLLALQVSVATFAAVNLDSALIRYFHEAETQQARDSLVTTIFAATTVCCALAVGPAALAAPVLSQWLFESHAQQRLVLLSLSGVPFTVLTTLALTTLRLERRAFEFGGLTLAATIVQLTLMCGAALVFRGRLDAILEGQLIALAITAVITLGRIRRSLIAPISRPALRRALGFALPYFPSVVIGWYMSLANRLFLASWSTLADVAAFAVASKLQGIVLALIHAFLHAWRPFAMSRARSAGAARLLARVMITAIIGLSMAAILTALSSRWILGVYAGPAYANAAFAASVLVLSTSLSFGIAGYFVLRLELAERTGSISLAQVAAFAATTVLNVWLIPRFGYEGAALAVLGGTLVQAVGLALVARRTDDATLPWWAWAPPAIVAGLLAGARLGGWL